MEGIGLGLERQKLQVAVDQREVARGNKTINLDHLFSDWWQQLDFQWLVGSVIKQV